MERIYAYGKRFGYKRARWQALWRVNIQQLPVATVQNLKKNVPIWKTGKQNR
jgi:IS5 family transposase